MFTELTTPEKGDRPTYKRGISYRIILSTIKINLLILIYIIVGEERLPEFTDRYGEKLYLPDGYTPNYYFGMEMDAKFIQGKNGYYDGNPMKYDSQVMMICGFIRWCFSIGMGGCQEARSGSIDFSTGEVTVENQNSTTLKDCFKEAEKYNENDWNDNGTFKDYTTHTIKMFYMERGAGASNLKINLIFQQYQMVRLE